MTNGNPIDQLRDMPGNAELLDELRDCVNRLCVVPFVGAGISVPFGYPGWSELLRTQGRNNGVLDDVNNELALGRYEEAAAVLVQTLGVGFDAIVTMTFRPKAGLTDSPIEGVPQALTKLTHGPVVTTNYDEVLELAYEQQGCRFRSVARPPDGHMLCEAFSGNRNFLLKIHGHWAEEDNRILTLEQYERFYGSAVAGEIDLSEPLPQALRLMFLARSVLFLGCSLKEDRYLRMLKRLVSEGMRTPVHFAVLEDKGDMSDRRRTLANSRIFPIFFPKGRFDLIEEVVKYAASDMPAAAPVPAESKPAFAAVAVAPLSGPPPPVPEALQIAVNDGRCVAFIGAGASFDAGFPSWSQLAHDLVDMTVEEGMATPEEERALRFRIDHGNILEAIDFSTGRVPKRVHSAIRTRLDAHGLDSPTHDLLARIPFRAALTSNYDTFLEQRREGSRVVLPEEMARLGEAGAKELMQEADPFPVIKVHGTARHPETIMFGSADYDPWFAEHPGYGDFLVHLFSKWNLFFYGQGLGDGRILHLLERAHLATGAGAPRHHAVILETDPLLRRTMSERYGIHLIPAEGRVSPQQLNAFLDSLAEGTAP